MQNTFHGRTADELWCELAGRFAEGGDYDLAEGRGGRTAELLHVGLSIEDPRQRWVPSREPPLNLAYALAEVFWILGGRRDAAFLRFWNSKLPDYVGTEAELHGAYGHRLRNHFGIDQLERAASVLMGNPSTRQVVLQIWDAATDLPEPDGSPAAADIPCNVMSLLKVRKGRLEWTQIVRSNDLFLGVPYNLVQFTFLQEVLAGWLGLEPGTYTQVSDSLHAYERDWPAIRSHARVELAASTDRYDLPKPEYDRVVVEMTSRIERLIAEDLSIAEVRTLVDEATVPEGYVNILRILAAESARRRQWTDAARTVGARCTNPALLQMWGRWCATRRQRRAA